MAHSKQQSRLLFKIPLDKPNTKIHPDPGSPVTSLFIITQQGDLYFGSLTGRQLKYIRNNVESLIWISPHRFLLLDAVTHDFVFYKIESPSPLAISTANDTPVQFIAILQFAFQFVGSILLEFGLTLKHDDLVTFLSYHPLTGYLDFLVKDEVFVRVLIDAKKRIFSVISCLSLGRRLLASTRLDLTSILSPSSRKAFFVSSLENEFLFSISLKDHLPARIAIDPVLVSFSPDFRWLVIVSASLEVFQIFLPVFRSSPCSSLHRASLHALSFRIRFQDDDVQDSRKVLRRVNAVWERECGDTIAKNNAKEHFTASGWLFPENDSDAHFTEKTTHVVVFQVPPEFDGLAPLALHCTETEIYVTAKNRERKLLLGVKRLEEEEAVWLMFPEECLITFPVNVSYPVILFYSMSVAVVAVDKESGFQKSIAESAAPDPWEDLTENQVMEVTLLHGIVDKALDYLQRRYPDRKDLFDPGYPALAARSIAKGYLQECNITAAAEILSIVGLDIRDEIQDVFITTFDPIYRGWLRDALDNHKVLRPIDARLCEYLAILEAHCDEKLNLQVVSAWKEEMRQERLLIASIDRRNLPLTDTFSPCFIWKVLIAEVEIELILAWIRDEADFTGQKVDASLCEALDNTVDPETSELIRNQFATQNVFSEKESSDFQLFIRRLMAAFGEDHPFFQKKNPARLSALPPNLRKQFLDFCVERNLITVIMDLADETAFLTYLAEKDSSAVPKWLQLLLLFRNSDLKKLGNLTELCRENAEFCWPDDSSIQRLLELPESNVTLGLIALLQNSWPPGQHLFDGSESLHAISILQKQLSKFPKLKEALFPVDTTSTERLAKNIDVYRLLQASAPYDPRKLFGWQSTNTINTLYRAIEMPSFSTVELQEKFGYRKGLDFPYYLKNSRPSFAYWSFIGNLTPENFKDELMAGRDMAFFLALFFHLDNAVVGACVAFLEMLGIESLSTRVCVEAARRLHNHRQKVYATAESAQLIPDIFIELFKYGLEVAGAVLEDLISATTAAVSAAGLYAASWEAASFWVLIQQFAQLFDLPVPLEYLKICAANNEWLNFLTFCEVFQYPLATVMPLLDSFSHPHIRANLRLILQHARAVRHDGQNRRESVDPGPINRNIRSSLYNRIGVAASDRTTSSTSEDDVARASKDKDAGGSRNLDVIPNDMVETLCLAQKSLRPWRELLIFALEFQSPIYAMIASGEPGVERIACLAVNLFTGLPEDDIVRYRSQEDLPASLSEFHWSRKHVESLVKLYASRDDLRLVNIAFALVAQDSVIEQFITIAADITDREEREVLSAKLKKLLESLQRAARVKPEKTREEVEDFKWGLEFGLFLWADLLAKLKIWNEFEWRGILQIMKDWGVHLSIAKLRRENAGVTLSDAADKFVGNISGFSQSAQIDASRLLELRSLLRDFQQSSLWSIESFRMEIWQSIFGRVHVELSEKQSTHELIEMLTVAVESSQSPSEKNVLSTIIWILHDSDANFRASWLAKIAFAKTTSFPPESWLFDTLLGAGNPISDLQGEILALGKVIQTESPKTNGFAMKIDDEELLEEILAILVKHGNLSLAARLSGLFGCFNGDLEGIKCGLALARGVLAVNMLPDWIVQRVMDPTRRISVTLMYSNDGAVNGESEDEVVGWLTKIAGICTVGRDVVLTILDNYCFARFLEVGFEDMLIFSTSQILERLFALPSLDHLSLAKRCLVSFKANPMEVTAYVSDYVIKKLRAGLAGPQSDPKSVGDSIKPFLAVAVDLTSLGSHLTDFAMNSQSNSSTQGESSLSLRTEILIAAHDVITKAGHLEGLARLLAACRTLSKSLVDAADFHSLLRLLNGVGRYSELTFIFHLFKEADQMEMLFSRGVDKDPKLKNAILNYLRKFHADDADTFEMLAAAYSMHREIGETFLAIAQDKMALFKHRPIVDTGETQTELKRIAQFLMDAANSFSRAECYSRTEKCIEQARLVALQIVFLPTGLRLLSLNNPSGFVSTHPRFAESYIYAQAYGIGNEWGDAVYLNYVLNGDISYLQDFQIKYDVTVTLVTEVAKKFKIDPAKPPTAVIYMKKLLRLINDIEVTYQLANDLAINDLAMEILQIDGGAFLRDAVKF